MKEISKRDLRCPESNKGSELGSRRREAEGMETETDMPEHGGGRRWNDGGRRGRDNEKMEGFEL